MQTASPAARTIDVTMLIDSAKVGRFQYWVLTLCMCVLFFDGYDTQAVGYATPAVAPALHIDKASMAWVFAIGLVGLMVGACIFSPLADHFPPRPCSSWTHQEHIAPGLRS